PRLTALRLHFAAVAAGNFASLAARDSGLAVAVAASPQPPGAGAPGERRDARPPRGWRRRARGPVRAGTPDPRPWRPRRARTRDTGSHRSQPDVADTTGTAPTSRPRRGTPRMPPTPTTARRAYRRRPSATRRRRSCARDGRAGRGRSA